MSVIDDQDEPNSGKVKVRVFNAAPDAGTLDVYLTESTAALEDTIPTVTSTHGNSFGLYTTVDHRTFSLGVTAVNDKTDVRLDVEGFDLADKARVTIVLQPGPGGVLDIALISQYKGDVLTLKNTLAQTRLATGATHNAAVTASLGASKLRQPAFSIGWQLRPGPGMYPECCHQRQRHDYAQRQCHPGCRRRLHPGGVRRYRYAKLAPHLSCSTALRATRDA